jgi:hypothetical protein
MKPGSWLRNPGRMGNAAFGAEVAIAPFVD